MMAELLIGRKTQKSAVGALKESGWTPYGARSASGLQTGDLFAEIGGNGGLDFS